MVQPIDKASLYFFNNPLADVGVAQLVLCLAFKNRILYLYQNGAGHSFANVFGAERLLVKIVDAFYKAFLKRVEVSSAVGSVLAVDKAKVVFAVAVCVGKGKADMLSHVASDWVKA